MRLSLKLARPSDVDGPKIRQAFQMGWLAGAHRHDEQASRLPAPPGHQPFRFSWDGCCSLRREAEAELWDANAPRLAGQR